VWNQFLNIPLFERRIVAFIRFTKESKERNVRAKLAEMEDHVRGSHFFALIGHHRNNLKVNCSFLVLLPSLTFARF